MSARINAAPVLDPDSLQFAAFEKIRRVGADRADGGTFFHQGIEYGLTVDMPSRLELVHVVIQRIGGPAPGHQQAMAVLCLCRQDCHDVKGLNLVMAALADGVVVKDALRPEVLSWRVLPVLPVPSCYATPPDDKEPG